MKRLLSLLLVLSLLLSAVPFALSEGTMDVEDLEDEDYEVDADGNIIILKEAEDGDFSFSEEDQEKLDELAEQFEIDDTVDPDSLELNPNLPDNVVNILLIGLDVRGTKEKKLLKEQAEYSKRGDVQMILSINKDDGSIKLTSIARNTYVEIPGRKNKTIIANSYGHGNYDSNGKYVSWTDTPEVAMRTVNHNFQLNIQSYVAVNFYGVVSIIEYLGGADIDLTKKEAKAINTYLSMKTIYKYKNGEVMKDADGKKMLASHGKAIAATYDDKNGVRDPLEARDGVQHLDGLQALIYARLREIDNDFVRTARTRHLLDCLLKPTAAALKNGSMDPFNLLIECSQYFKTNMNLQDMVFTLMPLVLNSEVMSNLDEAGSLISEFRIPEDKTYHYDTVNGSSVTILNDKQATTEALHNFIYGSYYPAT